MRFERRLLKNLDYVLIVTVLLLVATGFVMVRSATQTRAAEAGDPHSFVKRQVLWAMLGIGAAVVVVSIDYHQFARLANLLYVGNLALLAALVVVGKSTLGAQRWIQLGPVQIQPSELAKLALIVTLAAMLSRRRAGWTRFIDLARPLVHVALPMLLVLRQPDLGTSLVLLAILFGMLFVVVVNLWHLLVLVGAGVAASPLLWAFLEDYQKKRILVFLNPGMDRLKAGYQIIQSEIAIGSGRVLGKGLFAGTQNQLKFLPFQHTDFIFSVVGEELGFLGAMLLLALYGVVIWRSIRIAAEARDGLGVLLAVGVVSMLTFHVVVNVGMTMGIMPVTGIPLPFVSYGGSSLLTNMVAVGILLNVSMRRHKITF